MDVTLIKVLCVVMSVAMVVSVTGPAQCRQRHKSCLRRGKSEQYCERMEYKCIHLYCVHLSNRRKKNSPMSLVSCYVRNRVPALWWNKLSSQ
ncbi:hypothetical protein ScPMuIL_016876 [Solemya velum]